MKDIRKIPYGVGDFESVQINNDYYVDKTMFIPKIELTRFVFLIRPRRFGKTLLLSMLETYYDIKKKDRFEEFYKNTWILKNPTKERSKYLVLYFNFSAITKDKDKVQQDFNNYCKMQIDKFIYDYKEYLPDRLIKLIETVDTSHEKLQVLARELKNHEKKIYLLIDEYDNFTNTLLAEYGPFEYLKITKETGYYKQFWTNLKLIASGSSSGLERMFITGVSPVTMDDVTSGFNIGNNISTDNAFNEILGFTERDVHEIIDYYTSVGVFLLDKEETLQIMRKWYNNYKFHKDAKEVLFNTDAILYFMNRAYESVTMVSNLIDDNLRMDYTKLRQLILIDQKLNCNFSRLKEIIEFGGIASVINTSFPYEHLTQQINFISLLYFLGLLTFSGKYKEDNPFLKIPNESIRKMMYEYIRSSYEDIGIFSIDILEINEQLRKMAYRGDFKPFFKFIAKEMDKQTSIRDYIQGEKLIHGFFLAYMNLFDYYISLSEEERNKGYADLVLKPFTIKFPNIKYAYILEFKYITRTKDKKKLEKLINEKIKQSKEQLDKYSDDEFSKKMFHLPPYGNITLKKGIIIFHGWELCYIEEV